MIKKYFVIFFSLIYVRIYGQEIKTSCSIDEPRVNQSFNVTFDLIPMHRFFSNKLPGNLTQDSTNSGSKVTIKVTPKDTGLLLIGPYSFEFENKIYKTDQLKLYVVAPLKKKEVLEIRLINKSGEEHLIIEQYVHVNLDSFPKNSYDLNRSMRYLDSRRACLRKDPLKGFSYKTKSTNTGQLISIENAPKNEKLMYSFQEYLIINNSDSDIVLTRDFFTNLPSDFKLNKIIIKRTN